MTMRLTVPRKVIGTLLALISVAQPLLGSGRDGKRYFKEGIVYASRNEWDKAAEQLALAVAESPSNSEYQLHLKRALVNAAVMLVQRGDLLAAQKEHRAAYNAFQQAQQLDPTNELAAVKMRHMLEALDADASVRMDTQTGAVTNTRTGALLVSERSASEPVSSSTDPDSAKTPHPRPLRSDVVFRNANLAAAIEQIAGSMHLNVLFDQQLDAPIKARTVTFELRDVTAGETLEMLLRANNLIYTQIGRRTIAITSDQLQTRGRFEQMAVRSFYIKNADPADVRTAITATLGTKQITIAKQVNALIVRDSPANLDLIAGIIDSIDKSKAEVLIDVNLYEVSHSDLLQLGNQFSADSSAPLSLLDPGGVGRGATIAGAARILRAPFGIALGLPPSTVSIFQDKGRSKLLASTQVHVLDNEQHQIRIGQRVPVKVGSSVGLVGLGSQPTGGNNSNSNSNSGLGTVDNIQYEAVGLNIDMQPQVFDDEVQVKMRVESSSVDRSTGALTPSFNQRTMSSVARMKDGQTTMIAGVSRNDESKDVKGIPLVGLIPILGRFFSTPTTSNQQNDVVITVTAHILRHADIRDGDHYAKEAGRGSDASRLPTLEEILYRADQEDAREERAVRAKERAAIKH